ncbi:hypothetical protein OEA41_008403 [Lepraria neglecta]|uniref:Uncharacterized protein n=1 Tax=Lepraria neglecta TaxID=209136 RepID=A0AAE0DQZ1_9LECA|nr:hypothetical protein OEA41_008403 [Lepraria neglecta]
MADNTGDDLVIIATWEAAVQVKVDELRNREHHPDVRATYEDSPGSDVLAKADPGGFFVTREAEKPDLERMNLAADLQFATCQSRHWF